MSPKVVEEAEAEAEANPYLLSWKTICLDNVQCFISYMYNLHKHLEFVLIKLYL